MSVCAIPRTSAYRETRDRSGIQVIKHVMPTSELVPLILAGGRGTRIAHVFPNLPKPAVPVAGQPFLAWIIRQLNEAGFTEAVISTGHLASRLRSDLAPRIPVGMRLTWVEEPFALGTGGGAAYAACHCGLTPSHWLVLNGDSFLASDWPRRVRSLRTPAMTIVALHVDETRRYGRLVAGPIGRLTAFAEKAASGPGMINAGIYVIPSPWLAEVPREKVCGMETELIPGWLGEGRPIEVLQSTGDFLDVGTPESLERAEDFILRHVVERSAMTPGSDSSAAT